MAGSAELGPPRSTYRLMIDPVFGPFFWGKTLAAIGIWVHNVVAALVAFQVSGSAFAVGLVTAVQFAPQVLFAPWSGKVADSGNLLAQMLLGQAITGVGSGGLGVLLWAFGGPGQLPGLWPVLLCSALAGFGYVVGGPAMHSVVPSLVRTHELAPAMALNNLPMTVARAAGPAIGVFTAAQLGGCGRSSSLAPSASSTARYCSASPFPLAPRSRGD